MPPKKKNDRNSNESAENDDVNVNDDLLEADNGESQINGDQVSDSSSISRKRAINFNNFRFVKARAAIRSRANPRGSVQSTTRPAIALPVPSRRIQTSGFNFSSPQSTRRPQLLSAATKRAQTSGFTPGSPSRTPTKRAQTSGLTPGSSSTKLTKLRQALAILYSRRRKALANRSTIRCSPLSSAPTSGFSITASPATPSIPNAALQNVPPSSQGVNHQVDLLQVLTKMQRLQDRVAVLEGHVTDLAILATRNALRDGTEGAGLPQHNTNEVADNEDDMYS